MTSKWVLVPTKESLNQFGFFSFWLITRACLERMSCFQYLGSHRMKLDAEVTFFLTWPIFKKKDFIYLFLESGEDRERNISVWLLLVCPLLGTWPTTQACGLTGNRTMTLWFTGPRSVHWATPARAWCRVLEAVVPPSPAMQLCLMPDLDSGLPGLGIWIEPQHWYF